MASTTSRPSAIVFSRLHRTTDWVAKPAGFRPPALHNWLSERQHERSGAAHAGLEGTGRILTQKVIECRGVKSALYQLIVKRGEKAIPPAQGSRIRCAMSERRPYCLNRQSKHQRQGRVHVEYEIGGSLQRRQPRQ